jgi:hypothetical protein
MNPHFKTPQFRRDEKPAEIVAAAGEWVAERVGGEARYLRSTQQVVWALAGRTFGLTLEPSKWNRAGAGTWVSVRVWVRDPLVADWQKQHAVRGGGEIFSSLIVNLGFPPSVELYAAAQLTDAEPQLTLAEFWRRFQRELQPQLELFAHDPATVITRLPDRWLVFPEQLFWFPIAYDDKQAAKTLLARYFQLKPATREPFEAGRAAAAAGEPAPFAIGNLMHDLGRSVVTTGALAADERV